MYYALFSVLSFFLPHTLLSTNEHELPSLFIQSFLHLFYVFFLQRLAAACNALWSTSGHRIIRIHNSDPSTKHKAVQQLAQAFVPKSTDYCNRYFPPSSLALFAIKL